MCILIFRGTSSADAVIGLKVHPISLGIATNYQYRVNVPNENPDFTKLESAGVRYMREGILWHIVQPASGSEWNWASYDAMFARAARLHATILPVLAFGTRWASPGGDLYAVPNSPVGRAAYARYVRAVVVRYGKGGRFWKTWVGRTYPIRAVELWNEPWFLGSTTPYNYALLVHAAASAAHSVDSSIDTLANIDDRNVQDTDGRWMPWGQLVLQHKALLRDVDGWAMHPYPTTAIYMNQAISQNSIWQVNSMAEALAKSGLRGRIWITEVGFSDAPVSFDRGATPETAARNYTQFIRAMSEMTGPQAPTSIYIFTAARPNASTHAGSWDYGYNLLTVRGSITKPLSRVLETIDQVLRASSSSH